MYDVSIHNGDDVRLIHDHRAASNAQKLVTASIVDAVNSISAFKFEINPDNVGYDKITEFGTIVKVWNSKRGRYDFIGRVLQIDPEMDDEGMMYKTVMCEDRMSFLHDSIQPFMPKRHFKGDASRSGLEEFIDLLLDAHNTQVEEYKRIHRGRVTVDPFKTSENVTKGLDWETTYEALVDKLLNSFGGYLVLRDEDGVLYLDYLESVGETRETAITVGRNMSSVKREINTSEIVTRIIPLGYKYSSEDEESTDERLTIASVNNGAIYVESAELVEKYGIRYGVVIFDDVTEPGNLMRKGMEYFSENGGLIVSHDVSALDLSLIDLDIDDFVLYDSYPVQNFALGIDDVLQIVKKTTDVIEPYNSSFEMGDITKKMSDIMVGTAGSLNSIRQEVTQVGERITKTEIQIVEATNELTTRINETTTVLEQEIESNSSEIKQLAGSITSQVTREEFNELGEQVAANSSTITQTAKDIRAEVADEIAETEAKITVEANKVRSEVSDDIADVNSKIEQTASSIRSEVSSEIDGVESKIEQTAQGLRAEVSDDVNELYSAINTSAGEIRAEVSNIQIGGRNYILGTGTPYTAVGTGERQWLFPWPCASVEAANSLFGKTVTISFDCDAAITSGEFHIWIAGLWWGFRRFDSSTPSGHFTWTSAIDTPSSPTDESFIYIDGTWTGSVTFSNVKVEIGNKATDWTPAPEDTDAAISELSAAITVQAGVISANAQKIETVSQAAGAAQDTANAAQNAASGAQSTASGAVTRVTAAEQRISAVEGEITSKVSKKEFDELGNTVSEMGTEIRQNEEEILLLAGRKYGGRNYILGTGTPYTAVGTGTRQWLYPWHCASSEAANRLFGNTVTISFDYDAAITSGSLLVQTNILWWGVKSFGVGTESKHFSLTRKYDAAITADDVFIYIDGTWTGSVTFRNLKVELGDTATDWTPAPEDAAKSVDTGGAVRIDQTGVHMSGGTIEMETADGDEYIHIRNDGISASSLSAPNVAKRYSGPTGLYVNPNATSAQIAAGNYFRSISDALATINNRMLDYNVFVNMSSGMSDYADAVISGVYGDGSILIYGENATIYGTVTVRNSHAQVHISQLHVAIPSGVDRAAYEVRNAFLTIYSSTMSGNHRAFTVDVNGYLDARSCVFKVNAENSAYVLRSTASFESCIGNGVLLCHRGNMTAYGTVPIGGASYWESCVPNNVSSLVPTGTDGTPAAPVISTVTYNYTSSDSYRGGWSYFDTDAPRQGFNGMDIYGTIWFDAAAIRSALSGKTIKQASLRLFMVKGVGRGRSVVVQLHGTNMGYDGRSGRPELTTSYGTIGTTEPDMNNEMTIPTAVIDDIVSGRIQALVLKSDDTVEYKDKFYSENYARFEGSTSATTADNCPRLTVVYQ